MPTLNIAGKKVTVGDDFLKLSPDEQNSTVDEIAKSIGATAQQPTPETQTETPAKSQPYASTIFPVSRDAEGNIGFDSNAGILGAAKRAITAPGRALAGEIPMWGPDGHTSPEMAGEAGNMAAVFGAIPTPAAGTGKALAARAAQGVESPGMEAAAAASRLGVNLPRAVTSDSRTVQQLGQITQKVPGAGAPLQNASQRAIEQLGQAADDTVRATGTGNVANAGNAARTDITKQAKALAGRVTEAYDGVDNLITQNVTTPLKNTADTALKISSENANAALPEGGAVARVREALSRPEGLNYQGVKRLRTSIGEALDSKESIVASGASEAELKRLYGSLSDDLREAVKRGGGDKANAAFEEANKLAARTSREREGLQKVLGRDISDEKLFDRVVSMAGSNARADRVSLARVRGAVGKDTWDEIGSGVIARLGRDPDGNFSPDRFITGYGKISPEGKQALFGQDGLAKTLDDIATVSRRFKQLNQYANPSGSGAHLTGAAIGSGLITAPISTIAAVAGARTVSSMLARPTSAKVLAAYSRAYANAAEKPNPATIRALENTSRAVSAYIANSAGDKGLAAQIYPQISTISRVPAQPGNENQNVNEGQDNSISQQPRYLMPNEI